VYRDFLPPPLVAALLDVAGPVPGIPGLLVTPSLMEAFPDVESPEILEAVVEVARSLRPELGRILAQRTVDRAFVDAHMAGDGDTDVIGERDGAGRIVIGPAEIRTQMKPVDVPPFMAGPQVTLFGPPDSAKMSINAMNALHRRLPGEDPLVAKLVSDSGHVPRWGADSEDSKTPMAHDLRLASRNLKGCFDGTLSFDDPENGKSYRLAEDGLALPVKRLPGIALPDGDHLLDGEPLPLHLVELVQHIWLNRTRPEARVLYFPKLENDEEAAYLARAIGAAERAIQARFPDYPLGTVRVILVFENPRAIFRIQEMGEALYPYFLGGSLGWHDFLASTARLFRFDSEYRIPVKSDPDIVIRNIRESHDILVRELKEAGALKIGGMYGILYQSGDIESFAACMVGYIRDVVTQLKRGLDGFWVAHPDFVRIGIAIVEAWRQQQAHPSLTVVHDLVRALVPLESEHDALLAFIDGPDVGKLDVSDPHYLRAVLASEIGVSPVIANDDPEEVRYNIFQALQYLADWLRGNGCVALPAKLKLGSKPVFVRVMDDLATTERSRWEVWAEVHHGRVSMSTFDRILSEEMDFIREGAETETKRTEVAWEGEAARWYPLAEKLLRQLMTGANPPEFVTELLMPFTFPVIRDATDPWAAAKRLCPGKFQT
jgi:malate synthase